MPLFNLPHKESREFWRFGAIIGVTEDFMRVGATMAIRGGRQAEPSGEGQDGGRFGRSDESPRPVATKSSAWRPRSAPSPARRGWHGRDPTAGRCNRRGSGSGRRLRRPLGQSQRFAHFGIELGHHVFVVFQELARILAALPNAFALVAVPGAGFFDDVVVRRPDRADRLRAKCLRRRGCRTPPRGTAPQLCSSPLSRLVREPVTTSPSLIAAMRRISMRTEE